MKRLSQRLSGPLSVPAILLFLAVQGCAFAPEQPQESEQRSAMVRWNQCLQRFDSNLEHYCDGHRRDVLATFPFHMENQVDKILSEQMRVTSASRLVKTGLHDAEEQLDRLTPISLTNAIDAAREGDL